VTTPAVERRVLSPSAIFTVTDTFVTLRGVDGPASARHVRGTLAFQLTAMGSGAGRQSLDPGWTLPVVQGASGAFISYGTVMDPGGQRSRLIGPPLDVDLTVVGPAYRATALPPPAAPGQPAPAAPQLVNLDPSQPPVPVTPFPVQLGPGYGYPFPASPSGYSIVRGEVSYGAGGAAADQAQVTGSTAAGTWSDGYLTDRTGQWVFVIPDGQAGQITITATDAAGATAQAEVNVATSSMVAVPPLILT